MKFIYANNYFYIRGGAERVFLDEIQIVTAAGHTVIPFSRQFDRNINSNFSKFFASPIEFENVSLFKKIPASLELVYSYECKRKFSQLIKFFKPDLVHLHNIYGRLTASIIDAAKKEKMPTVMTLHDYKLLCPSYLMLNKNTICEKCRNRRFYYCVITKCHKGRLIPSLAYTIESYFNFLFKKYGWIKFFICPSKFIRNKLADAGIPDEKLVYIPNFVRISQFQPSFAGGNYILYIGRISKEKGILNLLNAVKGLDVLLKIIGEGPSKGEYETYALKNNITNVVFMGHKVGEELNTLLKKASFLIFPSEWYENAPMTILEAFALGKPIVASNIGGIPEMVIDHKTGLLFKPGDYQELSEKINYLLFNPDLITKMGQEGRKIAEEKYDAQSHYQNLMKVYEKACT